MGHESERGDPRPSHQVSQAGSAASTRLHSSREASETRTPSTRQASTRAPSTREPAIREPSVTPRELARLGSPFAHTPMPADLIDLWDETDRFFDALGDPTEFIEPTSEHVDHATEETTTRGVDQRGAPAPSHREEIDRGDVLSHVRDERLHGSRDAARTPPRDSEAVDQERDHRFHSGKLHSDEPHSDELHSDELHSDELHSDELHSDELHSDKLHSDPFLEQLRARSATQHEREHVGVNALQFDFSSTLLEPEDEERPEGLAQRDERPRPAELVEPPPERHQPTPLSQLKTRAEERRRAREQRVHERPAHLRRLRSSQAKQTKQAPQTTLAERFERRHVEQIKLIVLAGGKGGVGRSLIAANLALSLSRISRDQVVVADLDPLGSNLHTYLGLEPILTHPGQLLRRQLTCIAEQVPNTSVVSIRVPQPVIETLTREDRERSLQEALDLKPRWLIIDAGMMPDAFTLELFVHADYSVVMYTPDPSSIERSHAFLQSALYRQLIGWGDDASMVARSLLKADYENQIKSPSSLARALQHMHPEASRTLKERIERFCPQVIINQCRTRNDQVSGEEICSVLRRKWRVKPRFLGAVSYDQMAHQSLIDRRPLALAYPSAAPSQDIERISRALIRDQLQTVEGAGAPANRPMTSHEGVTMDMR